jgi:hypothetical protein
MVADSLRAVACERSCACDGTMEGEDLPNVVLRYRGLERKLVGDVACFDGVAVHDDFTMTKQVVIHHVGSHHGDDELCTRK